MKMLPAFATCTFLILICGCTSPPLHSEITEHNASAVITMLNNGTDVESRQFWTERTALMIAAEKGDAEIVRILLENGARVNARDLWKNTPLNYAVWGENLEVLKIILETDVHVNIQNIEGWTPLMHAVLHSNDHAVKELLTHGADVNLKLNWPSNETALSIAEFKGNSEITQLLLHAGARQNRE